MTRAEEKGLEVFPVDKVPYYGLNCNAISERDANFDKRCLFIKGYEFAEKDFSWHPASELPAIDEEVIVLLDDRSEVAVEPLYRIAFAHRVNPKYCEAYDTGGWNIHGVCWWMPCPIIPNEHE